MKRILTIIRRDLLSTSKDWLLLYITLAPLLLTLGARLFLPTMGQTAINLVVTREMPAAVVEQVRAYANVDVVRDRAALNDRVGAYDDAVGIVADGAGYTLVAQGNETHDSLLLPQMVLKRLAGGGIDVTFESITENRLPFRELVGAFVALSILFISGIVMAMHIIEDKESRMLLALGASPLGRREYVAARYLGTVVLSTASVFGCLWILGLTAFGHLEVLVVALVSTISVGLMGFVIGAISSNQIAGIASVKFGFLLILAPAVAAMFVPERWLFTLYWLPPYWIFISFRAILEQGASWGDLWQMLAWNLGTSVLLVALTYSWLKRKLDFARN